MTAPSLPEAKARLASAAEALAEAIGPAGHDMWVGDYYAVAATRLDEAKRLRVVRPEAWSGNDLDYVMFRCMTTMGGEATFRFILPRFLAAVAIDPFAGWASGPHVILSKLDMIDLSRWRLPEIRLLASALAAYAELEQSVYSDDEWHEPDADAIELLARARSLSS